MPDVNLNPEVEKNVHPVQVLATDGPLSQPRPGMALCLSGGGYRAMVFHLGTLWRLNELGLLKGLAKVSSVSGGSITAGMLGLRWNRLEFNAANTATNLEQLVVNPIRSLAGVKRVFLKPGEKQKVSFVLNREQMSIIDDIGKRIIQPGEFLINIGGKQPGFKEGQDAQTTSVITARFMVTGKRVEIR